MLDRVFRRLAFICFVCLMQNACSTTDDQTYRERKVAPLYNSAVNALEASNYKEAATGFNEVERQHPYSVWAVKAQLMAAYSNYLANNYDSAIISINRFIRLHPGSEEIAYAYYLKALSFYERISDVSRDQLITEQALEALKQVVRRFPNSKYARDAKLKIDLTHDHLAGKEMEIGRFYLKQNHYVAAINRFKRVVDRYQTTTHVPEALHRLVEAYSALGIADEAGKIAAVLGHNYSGTDWYKDTYNLVAEPQLNNQRPKRGFITRAWNWLF